MTGRFESTAGGSSVLAQLRHSAGLSQEALAEASGISVRSIRDIERGVVAHPRRSSLGCLADALGLDEDDQIRFEAHYGGGHELFQWPGPWPLAGVRVPAELPRDICDFVGRTHEQLRVQHALGSTSNRLPLPVVAIVGPGGRGKTALAVRCGHLLATDYPDGQLFVSLGGQRPSRPTTDQMLAELLGSVGVQHAGLPGGTESKARLFRSVLAGRRVLLLLDDAADTNQLAALLPGGPPAAVLVTSRSALGDLGAVDTIHLPPVSDVEAHDLLLRVSRRGHVDEDEPVADVAQLCGHLPLALRVVGARLAARPDWTFEHCRSLLNDDEHRLQELEHGSMGVQASLRLSYQALLDGKDASDRRAADTFVLLASLPGSDFSLDTAAAVLDMPEHDVDDALGRLLDVGLIECTGLGRFGYHDLTRLFAHGLSHGGDERVSKLLDQLGDFYLSRVMEAARMRLVGGAPPADVPEASMTAPELVMGWLHSEYANYTAYVVSMLSAPDPDLDRAHRLIVGMSDLTSGRRDLAMRRRLADALLDAASREPTSPWFVAWSHVELAEVAVFERDHAQVRKHVRRAREAAGGDPRIGARSASVSALALLVEGDSAGAERGYRQTLRFGPTLTVRGRASAYYNLCCALQQQGRTSEAHRYLLRSVRLTREAGSLGSLAIHLGCLAEVLAELGHGDRAVEAAREGVETARRLALANVDGPATYALALALRAAGRDAEAVPVLEDSLACAREAGNLGQQGDCHLELGALALAAGDLAGAAASATEALRLFELAKPGWSQGARDLLESCATSRVP